MASNIVLSASNPRQSDSLRPTAQFLQTSTVPCSSSCPTSMDRYPRHLTVSGTSSTSHASPPGTPYVTSWSPEIKPLAALLTSSPKFTSWAIKSPTSYSRRTTRQSTPMATSLTFVSHKESNSRRLHPTGTPMLLSQNVSGELSSPSSGPCSSPPPSVLPTGLSLFIATSTSTTGDLNLHARH